MTPHPDDRGVFGERRIVHLVHAATTGVHAHHALKVCIPLDGELTFGTVAGRALERGRGALVVAPDVAHQVGCTGAVLAVFVEPERAAGVGPPLRWIEGAALDGLIGAARDAVDGLDSAASLEAFCDEVLERLEPGLAEAPARDQRIVRVQRLLDASPRQLVPLERLAAEVTLSPSHLAHLFRAQVGIPVRRYGLWQRTVRGIGAVARSRTLCEAAYEAGFADQAHFTRTCRRLFGQPPSMIPAALRVVE